MQRAALFSLAAGATVVSAWHSAITQQVQRNVVTRPLPRSSILPNHGGVTDLYEPAVPKERTIEDDLPQLMLENELANEVDFQTSASEEDNARIVEFQSRLQQSIEMKQKMESQFKDELQILQEKLTAEILEEESRGKGIADLLEKFNAAMSSKFESVSKDEELLAKMREMQLQVRESAIESQLAQAVADKVTLCTIERELIEKMRDCTKQLEAELQDSQRRATKMNEVMQQFPSSLEDGEAVRRYSWNEVSTLRDMIEQSSAASIEREKDIDAIKQAFQDALLRRRQVLEPEIVREEEMINVAALEDAESGLRRSKETPVVSQPTMNPVIGDDLGSSLKESGSALVNFVDTGFTSILRFSFRPELGETFENLFEAATSVVESAASLGNAVSLFVDEWNSSIDSKLETTIGAGKDGSASSDWWIKEAFQRAASSENVKEALGQSGLALNKAGQSLVKSGKSSAALLASSVSDTGDKPLLSAASELNSALSKTYKAGYEVVDRELLNPPKVDFSGPDFILPEAKQEAKQD